MLQHADTKAKARTCAHKQNRNSVHHATQSPLHIILTRAPQPILFFANKMDISGHLQPVECVQVAPVTFGFSTASC